MTLTLSPSSTTAGYVHVTHRDVARAVLMQPEVFGPANALEAVTPISPGALRILQRGRFALPPTLANVHGAMHRATRSALSRLFSAETVRNAEGVARQFVHEQLDVTREVLHESGVADLAETVAGPPPTELMLMLTGWRVDDVAQLKSWSDDALELFWGWPDPERQEVLAASCVELFDWLRTVVVDTPNDFAAALERADLDEAHLLSLAFFVSIAGHQTTTYLANSALTWILDTPGAWAGAAHHPGGVHAWATEWTRATLAHRSSVHTWRRVTMKDTVLDGRSLPAGTEVVVHLTGNHFPGVELIPASEDYQLAFGVGLHRCLGAGLAEMELRVMLELTRKAFDSLALADSADTVPTVDLLSFSAPRSVPVVVT